MDKFTRLSNKLLMAHKPASHANEAAETDNAKVSYSKGSKDLSLTGWADGYAGWLGSQNEADG